MVAAKELKAALLRWCDSLESATAELNALDARLGDGDLGTTLQRGAANVRDALPAMPDQPSAIFKACASASAKASGSSFGTLLAQAFLTAARQPGVDEGIDRRAMVALLDAIVDVLSARGGASLGDKTMLDSLDAIARGLAAAEDGADLRAVARESAAQALERLRSQPNRIGRARMFADKSVGLDDPGMVAVLRMAQGL